MALSRLAQLRPVLQQCVFQPSDSSSPYPIQTDENIQVTPRVSLLDQKVHIRVHGLPTKAKVTLHVQTRQEWRRKPAVYRSCGHFVTSDQGDLDLNRDAAIGGTYTGLDPMGPFCSMRPCPSGPQNIRLVVRNGEDPILYTLSLYLGHWSLTDLVAQETTLTPVHSTTVTRLKKAADVRRIPVREGGVRGVLFLPPGDGPHPGVIDMFGAAGGLIEARAALLSSHGFAALALPFFNYDDLGTLDEFRFDYFKEAAAWLASHRAVKDCGIGVVGVSTGAMLGLMMAWQIPEVKAVVSINGPVVVRHRDIVYRKGGPILKKCAKMHRNQLKMTSKGMITKNICFDFTKEDMVPAWESSAHILMLISDDDQQVEPTEADTFHRAYPQEKRHLVEVVHYPGAGHLLEPPYTPHCLSCLNPVFNLDLLWGGNPADHAVAQEDSWKRILAFLRTHLS